MRATALLFLSLCVAGPTFAQSGVGVEIDDVIDDRVSAKHAFVVKDVRLP